MSGGFAFQLGSVTCLMVSKIPLVYKRVPPTHKHTHRNRTIPPATSCSTHAPSILATHPPRHTRNGNSKTPTVERPCTTTCAHATSTVSVPPDPMAGRAPAYAPSTASAPSVYAFVAPPAHRSCRTTRYPSCSLCAPSASHKDTATATVSRTTTASVPRSSINHFAVILAPHLLNR